MDIGKIKEIYGMRAPGAIGVHRFYSVLVPFIVTPLNNGEDCDSSGELSILYEVRSGNIRQPGEICFPGGHMEKGESPEECAVRETCEETGIGPEHIEVIGQGDTLYGIGGFTLYTFIGEVDFDAYSKAVPDEEEVRETFLMPVKTLMEIEPSHYGEQMKPVIEQGFPYEKVGITEDYPWRTASTEIPVYDIDGRVIWGLTARITENVVSTLKNE